MTKYKQVFQDMLNQNKVLFEEFKKIHDNFVEDPQTYKEKFNEIGQDVLDVIRRYENRLCSHSESSGYGKFSSNLADKFQEEIKTHFSKINSVGMK